MNGLPRLAFSVTFILIGMVLEVELSTLPPTTNSDGLSFQQNYNSVTIPDTHQVSTLVLSNINVTATASSSNLIQVSCQAYYDRDQSACSTFDVVTTSNNDRSWIGTIKLSKPLNAVTKSSYNLTLQASNGRSYAYQNIMINVIHTQTRPPVFQGSLSVNMPELNGVLTSAITQYIAQDGDGRNNPIRYQLNSNPGGYFRIEDVTGRLFNTLPIYFNSSGWESGFVVIEVEAAVLLPSGVAGFGNSTTSTKVLSMIYLVESTDYPPKFDYPRYLGAVDERSPVNTVVQGISLKVTDPNRNTVNSTFELVLDNYSNVFKVSPTNASQQTTASILVANSTLIDYDTGPQTYQFNVIARETLSPLRLSSSAMVTISLYPKNDYPPVFTQSVYVAPFVSELIPSGTFVLQVQATDRDIGRFGNVSIRYKFGEPTSLFRINATTGVITVPRCSPLGRNPCIDYETVKAYQIPVIATDSYGEGFQANAMVNITILDENDNLPVFSSDTYYGIIDEHKTAPYVRLPAQQITSPLQVRATDADSSRNGNNNVTYYITGGNTNNLWTINLYDGTITANRPVNYVDSDNGFFYLNVEARDPDPTHVHRASVNISVNPINTYTPVLTNGGTYNASILETIPPGSYIMTIKATDGDSPAIPNGMVRYRFLSGNQDLFTINDTTGEVKVAPGAKLDAIVQPQYIIAVRAYDLGTPSLQTDGILTITVIPNRPDPKFTLSDYRPPPILQSSPIGYNVTVVFANNTNPNRRIVYSFLEPITGRDARNLPVNLTQAEKQMFVIDPVTGRVTVNQPLNYDRVATWQAIIQAVDTNANSTVNPGRATLTITVLPVNDKPPVFSWPWTKDTPSVNKTLEQWDTPGNNIMDIHATSPNSSQTITYKLVDDYNGAFNISSQTGAIGLVRPLDITRDTDVKLVVIAVDNGEPPLTSTATIVVQLKNINKYRPQFTENDYSAVIFNDLPNGTFVIRLSATDTDSGDLGQIRYNFTNSPPDNRFAIDPMTGNITVTPVFNGTADKLIILPVRAYDSPNDPMARKFTDTTVQINIVSRNLVPPQFSQPMYSTNIPEKSEVGQPFIQVLAIKNNVINPRLIYSITSGNDQGLFAIDPNSGGISPKTSLIGKAGRYNLTVVATDDGTPSLSGTAFVDITVLASSYQIPDWVSPSSDGKIVYIYELDPRGKNVTQVSAINANSPSSPVAYYFFYLGGTGSNRTNDFEINSATGLITTARDIGYEGGTNFVVNVFAVDTFNTVARRTIVIVVRDIFEENPSFPINATDNCTIPVYWTVPLNAPNGSIVNTLTANLKDPNDIINYVLLGSELPKEIPVLPFALRPFGSPVLRSIQIVYNGNGAIKVPNKMINMTIRAQDGDFDVNVFMPRNPSKKLCGGVANQTDIIVHITIIETKPLYDVDLHTCIKDDADIGTKVFTFENLYPDDTRPVIYQLISVQTFSASGSASTPTNTEMGVSRIFNLSSSGNIVTLASMSDYKQQFFSVNANSSYDQLSFAAPSVAIYVVPYSREILATFNQKPEVVKANINNVISEIQSIYKDAKVCVVSIKYHVTDQGVVDSSSTDVLMYVIDRGNNVIYPRDLDKSFGLAVRRKTYIIGITEAYSFWAGFIYHPVAAAIGIILALLLLALILFCCCCIIWSRLLKCCRYTGDKEPLIYKASSLGVVNPVWTPKPQTEEQSLTMPVPDGDGVNRTIELMGEYNRPAIDMGDEDVIDTASRFQNGAAAGGVQSLSGYVHIEAPLTASRSPSAFGTPSAYGASQTRQEMTTTYESSATGAPHGGRESPYPDSSGAMDSHGSYSASGAMKFSRGTGAGGSPPPPRSHSTGTMTNVGAAASEPSGPVRLNDPGNGAHAKIGATLFRPGGQAYAQSVISGTTFGGGDQYDMLDDTAGMNGAPNDARMALPLDTEVMYSHVRPTSYYDDADIMPNQGGMYQGEVRVGRSSVVSEQLQETRFM